MLRAEPSPISARKYGLNQTSISRAIALLEAEGLEGIETATRPGVALQTPYRMTLLCQRGEGAWRITQAHGSSPHHG